MKSNLLTFVLIFSPIKDELYIIYSDSEYTIDLKNGLSQFGGATSFFVFPKQLFIG